MNVPKKYHGTSTADLFGSRGVYRHPRGPLEASGRSQGGRTPSGTMRGSSGGQKESIEAKNFFSGFSKNPDFPDPDPEI